MTKPELFAALITPTLSEVAKELLRPDKVTPDTLSKDLAAYVNGFWEGVRETIGQATTGHLG